LTLRLHADADAHSKSILQIRHGTIACRHIKSPHDSVFFFLRHLLRGLIDLDDLLEPRVHVALS
jgi:hypothetical protein